MHLRSAGCSQLCGSSLQSTAGSHYVIYQSYRRAFDQAGACDPEGMLQISPALFAA